MTDTKKNLTLIDADSLIFTLASTEKGKEITKEDGTVELKFPKSPRKIIMKVHSHIRNILTQTEADYYMGFFQQEDKDKTKEEHNFRYGLYPDYKGNRKAPVEYVQHWRPIIMAEFEKAFNFVPVTGFESDDAVCFMYHHYKDEYNVTIVANDKDTLQNAGIYYYDSKKNLYGVPDVLVKKSEKPVHLPRGEKQRITPFKAAQHTAYQLLIGDSGDNITGLYGVGPVKARKILEGCTTIKELRKAVTDAYKEWYDNEIVKIEKRKLDIEDSQLLDLKEKYPSDAGVERQLRMLKKKAVAEAIEKELGKSWKDNFKLQWRLLVMLKEVPEGFDTTIHEAPTRKVEEDSEGVDDILLNI